MSGNDLDIFNQYCNFGDLDCCSVNFINYRRFEAWNESIIMTIAVLIVAQSIFLIKSLKNITDMVSNVLDISIGFENFWAIKTLAGLS